MSFDIDIGIRFVSFVIFIVVMIYVFFVNWCKDVDEWFCDGLKCMDCYEVCILMFE